EATGGFVYSEMGIYTAKPDAPKSELLPGGGTNNTDYAETDPKTNQPVQNASRNVWVTETALATALNTSYMASQLSLFSLVGGIGLRAAGHGLILPGFGMAMPRSPRSVQKGPLAGARPAAARSRVACAARGRCRR